MSTKKTLTQEQVIEEATKYFRGDQFAAGIWTKKYALRNLNGEFIEKTPDDMHRREAKEFSRIEYKYPNPISEEEIYGLLKDFRYLVPQGSPMFGIGNPFQLTSLSNCFVISTMDSYGGICRADERIAQIAKRRGGVGIDVSPLRPKGMATKNAAHTTDGILGFMTRFSNTSREVAQSGRRGALMITCSVHHPEIMNVIRAKADLKAVTGANISIRVSDEFMKAVKSNGNYELRWPVDSKKPEISNSIPAKEVWDEIVKHAYANGEPGVLFWDTIIKNSPADCYAAEGFATESTNPCIVGDTIVYVADGRGNVPIKKLAEDGKDVDVFCYDKDGNVCVRKMRHPRLTGRGVPVFKVILDDGSTIRVTGNHKFRLRDGTYKETRNLRYGDSLRILTRYEEVMPQFRKGSRNKGLYYWLVDKFCSTRAEHRFVAESNIGRRLRKDEVVHHIDYDGRNNNPENLKVMTNKEHSRLHAIDKFGDKNPMRRAQTEWSEEKWSAYGRNMSDAVSAEKNGRFSGHSNDDIRQHAMNLTKRLGRRFSKKEWQKHARRNGLPIEFCDWRRKELGKVWDLSRWAATKCGVEHIDEDPRLVRTLATMLEQGYSAIIQGNQVLVEKMCETCHKTFLKDHRQREISFCSVHCSNRRQKTAEEIKLAKKRNNAARSILALQSKEQQVKTFVDLKFSLKRDPLLREWENTCLQQGIPHRLKTKHGFQTFGEVRENATMYNHRVEAVIPDGTEDVYNGTVDEFHNFFVGGFDGKTRSGMSKWSYVNNLNCGELPLCEADSCRLLCINLASYVKNPYKDNAEFDVELFKKHVAIAQRLMDDMIDLELECVSKIIEKIKKDPEPADVKANELGLWEMVYSKCNKGRRTGLGLTALGDLIAMMDIKYGDKKSLKIVETIYKLLRDEAYRSSVNLAKERGPFPIFNAKHETNHEYLERLPDDIKTEMKKYGRRNIGLLTNAPVGTTSNIVKNLERFGTTSGFEPLFKSSYVRRVKMSPNDDSKPDWIDENGDKWKEHKINHPGVQNFIELTGKNIEESPYFGAEAEQIDFVTRVKMQGIATSFVDHSISSTINLPHEATIEIVGDLYIKAWENGCKGLTVYRQGSRAGVLVDKKTTRECDECDEVNEKFIKLLENGHRPTRIMISSAPKRPKILDCDIVRAKVGKDEWVFVIGKLHGRPYEIFGGESSDLTLPKKYKTGWIEKDGIKEGKTLYDLVVGDLENEEERLVVRNIAKTFNNYQHAPFSRMISLGLRHGIPINWICEQITKDKEDDFFSFNRAMSRVLKKYIAEGESSGLDCPDCHNQMVYKNGCPTCLICGKSSCS